MYPHQKQEISLVVYSRSNLIGVKYIHLSLTHSLIHWPVHNIPPTCRLFFLQKKITKKGQGCLYLLGVKKGFWYPLGYLWGWQPRNSTTGAFKALSQKKYDRRCFVLEIVPLRVKKFQRTPTKLDHGTLCLLGVLVKMSDKHPCPFIWEKPPSLGSTTLV